MFYDNDSPLSVAELVELAIGLNPIAAIKARRDDYAAIMNVHALMDDAGNRIDLLPCPDGLLLSDGSRKSGYVFLYARVSTLVQRLREASGDGWSMRTQIERGIRYCLFNGWQFCLYSDAELSGGMPTNEPTVINKLWRTKAEVYRSVMRNIWLPVHLPPRPDSERQSIESYIKGKYDAILSGRVKFAEELGVHDEALKEEEKQYLRTERGMEGQLATINRRGQEVVTKIYRPGLNHLMNHIGQAAQLVVTDPSRVARSSYLMQHLIPEWREKGVKTVGLIEQWDWPNRDDIGGAITGGVLSALHEDTIRSATANALRGMRTRLERGEPMGLLPFWYVKIEKGSACPFCGQASWPRLRSGHHLCPKRVEQVQFLVRVYLDEGDNTERGYSAVARKLEEAGIRPKRAKGGLWHWTAVRKVLTNPALIGKEREFGLLWDVLDRIISEEDWIRVSHKVGERAKLHAAIAEVRSKAGRNLMTGLLRCPCGRGLSYRATEDNYICNMYSYGRVGTPRSDQAAYVGEDGDPAKLVKHTRISAPAVNAFFDELFADFETFVISNIPDEGEDPAAKRLEEVNTELMELTRSLPLIEDGVRREVSQRFEANPKYARAKGTLAYNDLIAAEVKFEMDEHYARRASLRERQKQFQAEQSVRLGQSFRAEAQERMAKWRDSSIEDRNVFLRTYFSAIKFVGEHGGEYLVPVLRDGETEWPSIPLRIQRWGNIGQVRRHLPSAAEYVKSIYASVVASAG